MPEVQGKEMYHTRAGSMVILTLIAVMMVLLLHAILGCLIKYRITRSLFFARYATPLPTKTMVELKKKRVE